MGFSVQNRKHILHVGYCTSKCKDMGLGFLCGLFDIHHQSMKNWVFKLLTSNLYKCFVVGAFGFRGLLLQNSQGCMLGP